MQGLQLNHFGPDAVAPSAPGSARGLRFAGRIFAGRRLGRATPGGGAGLKRVAFTLTELLVVIAIIGVLASLITAAAVNALRNAKRARVVLEIKNLSGSIENFKNDRGFYPPNAMNNGAAAMTNRIGSDFERSVRKAFPRINPTELEVFRALAGVPLASGTSIVTSGPLPNGMTAAEAIYFWFGGFSADPQFPLSGPGGPSFVDTGNIGDEILENRNAAGGYEFALGRLGPRVDGELDYINVRPLPYRISMNGAAPVNRKINLWQYYPDGSEQPYVYFDCSRYKPYQYDMPAFIPPSGVAPIFAIMQLRTGAPANPTGGDLIYANQKKFQILHCGLDDAWGSEGAMGDFPNVDVGEDPSVYAIYPTGPFTGEQADTLSNITDGELADSQE